MPAYDDNLYGVQEPRICSLPATYSDKTGI